MKKERAGQKFGRLTVLREGARKGYLSCVCDCGVQKEIASRHVVSGRTKSCGCLRIDVSATLNLRHGQARHDSRSATYKAWCGMIHRCTNPKALMYPHYGGRGIAPCAKWLNFDGFYADMGDCPEGYSLERKRVNDGYGPDNCEWIPKAHQAKNKTTTRYVVLEGERMIAADAARKLGVMKQTINKWRTGVNRIPAHVDISFV